MDSPGSNIQDDLYVNPAAPVYLHAGTAGIVPTTEWGLREQWSAARFNSYGYLRLTMWSPSELSCEFVDVGEVGGPFPLSEGTTRMDSFRIVRD